MPSSAVRAAATASAQRNMSLELWTGPEGGLERARVRMLPMAAKAARVLPKVGSTLAACSAKTLRTSAQHVASDLHAIEAAEE